MTTLSFEFFPPKTDALEAQLWHAFEALQPLQPQFVSVTYGAGGTTRTRTHECVTKMQAKGTKAAAHLTCVGASRHEIDEIAQSYWAAGIAHIVALRGDMPDGMGPYQPHPEGYATTKALIEGLRARAPFEISVGAYPEKHPEAPSLEADFAHFCDKVSAGATRAITQFFFDNSVYFRFLDRAQAAGLSLPIVPGILPITHFGRTRQFAEKCGTHLPPALIARFDGFDEKPIAERHKIAHDVALAQCQELLGSGAVDHLHFYTLNRAELVGSICADLQVVPHQKAV